MRIVLIGYGNLATQLGIALHQAGFEILQVYGRDAAKAARLSTVLGATPVTDAARLDTSADVYVCALKDAVLTEVLAALPRLRGLVVHTAGSIAMADLKPFADRVGVFYPLQTFSASRNVDFDEIPIYVEALRLEDEAILLDMGQKLSRHVQVCASEKRKQLHLAAVFACNFVNHFYHLAAEILEGQGLGFQDLLPLIDETARKVHDMSPAAAQTGPAVRYDHNVIDAHLGLLADRPEMKSLYEAVSRSIFRQATKNGS
ncbi:Rossmann-like and DUF2520 domain-containing protein [Gilvimarinus sp. F26214L]|uniref:Rossmann-like and DUF2520 domain-containing protein n=1 Tax=Gilvimarinus sp. DZF01 TaxID=3461371 RepID=UPI0040456CCF